MNASSRQRAAHGLTLIVLITAAGCASSKPTKDDGNYYLAAFEDFESDEHPDVVPPMPPSQVGHDIPSGLEGPVVIKAPTQGSGFRIQVFASRDKTEADAEVERAIAWWEANRSKFGGPKRPPVYIDYEQPWYKVRLGDYVERSEASDVADRLTERFKGAFVVPSEVKLK